MPFPPHPSFAAPKVVGTRSVSLNIQLNRFRNAFTNCLKNCERFFFLLVLHQRNITILSIHPWRVCQLQRCQELDQFGEQSWRRRALHTPPKSTGSSSRWKKMKECLLSGYNNNVELVRGMLGVFIMLCRIGANVTCLNNKMLYSKKRRRKKVKNKIKWWSGRKKYTWRMKAVS